MSNPKNQKNIFIEQTKIGLNWACNVFDPDLIAPRGFDVTNSPKGKCILIMGINPAGDAETAKLERNPHYLFLNGSIDNVPNCNHINNTYNNPVYNFTNTILGNKGNIKWDWCNKKKNVIEKLINDPINKELIKYQTNILQFHKDHCDPEYITIYYGDMFYYHMTSQSDFLDLLKNAYEEICPKEQKLDNFISDEMQRYCMVMLRLHLQELERHNQEVLFTYINNAKISNWLSPAKNGETWKDFAYGKSQTKIFYGSMLSGQRAMDKYSESRLINEIRAQI